MRVSLTYKETRKRNLELVPCYLDCLEIFTNQKQDFISWLDFDKLFYPLFILITFNDLSDSLSLVNSYVKIYLAGMNYKDMKIILQIMWELKHVFNLLSNSSK